MRNISSQGSVVFNDITIQTFSHHLSHIACAMRWRIMFRESYQKPGRIIMQKLLTVAMKDRGFF